MQYSWRRYPVRWFRERFSCPLSVNVISVPGEAELIVAGFIARLKVAVINLPLGVTPVVLVVAIWLPLVGSDAVTVGIVGSRGYSTCSAWDDLYGGGKAPDKVSSQWSASYVSGPGGNRGSTYGVGRKIGCCRKCKRCHIACVGNRSLLRTFRQGMPA